MVLAICLQAGQQYMWLCEFGVNMVLQMPQGFGLKALVTSTPAATAMCINLRGRYFTVAH